jgi:hypothetical protein
MRIKLSLLLSTTVALLLEASLLPLVAHAQTYRVGGFTSEVTPASDSWSWNGSEHTELRAALASPTYFGPGGIVPTTIQLFDLADANPSTLAGIDCLVVPWVEDGNLSNEQLLNIRDAFLNGMDIFLLQDGSDRDPVGAFLGIPSAGSSDGSDSTGTPGGTALFAGAFGVVESVGQAGQVGQLDPDGITANNGTVAARNASNQITAALWNQGQYAPGAGAIVSIGDVDMISGNFGGADYGPPLGSANNKGRFGLNIFAFLATNVGGSANAPEPSSLALIALIGAGIVARRRR